jgi:UDP:flavonoid glycosyltransferase YjiC (YdhE family)
VLITLGTHGGWHREAVVAAVHRAARQLPALEFHVSDGNRTSTRCESTANVHRIGFISYTRHLSRYALVVHHAGTGVLAHTLAAGIPAVSIPVDFDQFDYAARLEVAGVALRLRRLGDLARIVARVMSDESIRARCRHFQALLSPGEAEERVAERVARHFAGHRATTASLC